MSTDQDIQEQLKRLKRVPEHIFIAVVKAVDVEARTITIEDSYGIEYDDVRLTAQVESGDRWVQFPAEESWVLVGSIGTDENELYVAAYSQLEMVDAKFGKTHIQVSEAGFVFDREGENLQTVLNDFISEFGKLCDELSKVVVSMGVTPNIPAITQIKQEATQEIKRRLNTILIEE